MASSTAPAPVRPRRSVQFGPFEFDPAANELRKHGVRLRLMGQPLQLLAALLETPGEVVTRGELQKRLWPADTFVDFENGLNSAAKRLRGALNDSADHPVYIETLARTGYRFIAPVTIHAPNAEPALIVESPKQRSYVWPLIAAALAGVAIWLAVRKPEPPSFRQITFRKGPVFGARFAPDGQSVIFSAQFDQQPRQIYVNNGLSPEARALGLGGVSIFSVSRQGQLALYEYGGTMPTSGGRLTKVPINGGTPVPVDDNIMAVDWHPDGTQLALVRVANGQSTLEFPPGNILFRTAGWISGVRFDAAGKKIAFVDHPVRHDDAGWIKTVTLDGAVETLGEKWLAVHGVAWHPNGEVWYAATRDGSPRSLWAGSPPRVVGRFPGVITLRDVSAAGAVLLSRDQRRLESYANGRDVTWFDWTRAVDIADDGALLFDESGEAAGTRSVAFVRKAGAAEAARLADGWLAQGFSPDMRHALTLSFDNRKRLRLYPLAGGQPVDLNETGLEYQWARFFPDSASLLVLASEPSSGLRLFRVSLNGQGARPLSDPGMVRYAAVSPDSKRVAYLSASGKLVEISSGGETRELYAAEPLAPVQWSKDGKRLYVQHVKNTSLPSKVSKFDPATGRLESWRELAPHDPTGVDLITRVLISPDESQLVFSARRIHSELFTALGLR